MPDLSNLAVRPLRRLPTLRPCVASASVAAVTTVTTAASSSRSDTQDCDLGALDCKWNRRLRFPISSRGTCSVIKKERKKAEGKVRPLTDHVRNWVERKVADGAEESECELPFLTGSLRMVECRICSRIIYPSDKVLCSVRDCGEAYHRTCAKQSIWKQSSKDFRCPQHCCFMCKGIPSLRCLRCTLAWHSGCAPWPEEVIHLGNRRAICWRHTIEEKKHLEFTSSIEEAFQRLPLPYEDFSISSILKDLHANKTEPAPYVHIRRNVYLVKRKRDGAEADVGCTKCRADSTCKDNCECRGLSVSCSKACHCSDLCTNRPFRKEKKIKLVKTESCGWGAVALESMEKGDFVVEYIGEVIDDALCEQRLWDMKHRGNQNFYMCEIRKDFTIDATFKGNMARFLNHSCDPNCKLEKWQVDGETRVGVFTLRTIEVGVPLTYDYRFVHFGSMVKCCCGASNCQGYLGSKRKTNQLVSWGCRRKRTITLKSLK